MSMCYKCAPGKYNPLKGGNTSSSCIPCLAGQVSLEFGASKCKHCPNGTSPNARNSNCNPCPAGKYLDAIFRNCTECPKGRFSPSSGNAVCLPCKRGTYADYGQAVTCAHVPPGSVSLNCTTDFTACSAVLYLVSVRIAKLAGTLEPTVYFHARHAKTGSIQS